MLSDEEANQLGDAFERMKIETAKTGDSMVASTVELVANMMPRRFTNAFRKYGRAPRQGAGR